jgi:Skp family chaperone for outer membrane proteins
VKRMLLVATVTMLTLACLGGRLLVRGQGQAQVPTSTRVAVVNIGLVFSKYDKAQTYKKEMEKILEPFRAKGEKLKKEIMDWSEYIKHPKFDPKDRERYEQGILNNKRQLEDLDREARAKVGKRQEEQIITLYKDVNDLVKAYALNNGIHLVLAYGEQIEGDLFTFPNINRKMQGMDLGSANPLFFVPGVDISTAIADGLNQSYRAAGTAVPATPTSAGKN